MSSIVIQCEKISVENSWSFITLSLTFLVIIMHCPSDSEWEKSTGSIFQWIGWQAELKTPYCHQRLYQKVMKCSTSHCIMKNNPKFMHLLPHIKEKNHNKFHNRWSSNSQPKEKPRNILLLFTIHLWFRMFYILHLFKHWDASKICFCNTNSTVEHLLTKQFSSYKSTCLHATNPWYIDIDQRQICFT